MEVRRRFEDIDGGRFLIERGEVLSELLFEFDPVEEAETLGFGLGLILKLAGGPASSSAALHVREGPDDLGVVVCEGVRAEADVCPAGREERLALGPVAIEVCGHGRSEKGLPTGGRGRNCGCGSRRLGEDRRPSFGWRICEEGKRGAQFREQLS